MKGLAILAAGALGSLVAGGFAMAADTKHKIEELSWLTGGWQTADGRSRGDDGLGSGLFLLPSALCHLPSNRWARRTGERVRRALQC